MLRDERFLAVVRLLCTIAAGVAALFGVALDAGVLVEGAACVLALVCLLWSWWKNNNLTQAAIDAQEVLEAARGGSCGGDDGEAG